MDLTLALCESVPAHLEDDGCWYMQTTSPTVDGQDLLVSELTGVVRRKNLDITLTPVRYTFAGAYAAHRLRLGIESTTTYLAHVRHADRGVLKRMPLPLLKSLVHRTNNFDSLRFRVVGMNDPVELKKFR